MTSTKAALSKSNQPRLGRATLSGHGANRRNAPGAALASRSSTGAATDAYIGSDPDLARPLVPCDALRQSARGGKRSHSGSLSGSYALGGGPGATASAGYDAATGVSSLPPTVSSCISAQASRDDVGANSRDTSVYEQLAPDVANGATGSRRPGTLTLLRPFAN